MPRGRRPTPDALKELKGNPGRRKLHLEDKLVPAPSAVPLSTLMPDFLRHDRERALFTRVVEDFLHRRIARPPDINSYARWAVYMHRWMLSKEAIDEIQLPAYQVNSGAQRRWVRLPSFKDMLDLEHSIIALEDRLGLNPVSRQSIVRGLSTTPVDLGGLEDGKAKKKKKDADEVMVEDEPPSPIGFGKLN